MVALVQGFLRDVRSAAASSVVWWCCREGVLSVGWGSCRTRLVALAARRAMVWKFMVSPELSWLRQAPWPHSSLASAPSRRDLAEWGKCMVGEWLSGMGMLGCDDLGSPTILLWTACCWNAPLPARMGFWLSCTARSVHTVVVRIPPQPSGPSTTRCRCTPLMRLCIAMVALCISIVDDYISVEFLYLFFGKELLSARSNISFHAISNNWWYSSLVGQCWYERGHSLLIVLTSRYCHGYCPIEWVYQNRPWHWSGHTWTHRLIGWWQWIANNDNGDDEKGYGDVEWYDM